jgi:hypothetical protein
MSDNGLPSGWHHADQPDDAMTRYNPQPVTQYDHPETDVSVQLLPTETPPGRANESTYRIHVRSTATESAGDIDLLTTAPDHAAALDIARRFMQTYNNRYVNGTERIETIMEEFAETD